MHLPPGVTYHPRSEELVAVDALALVRIDTSHTPNNAHYGINARAFGDAVAPYLKGDWAALELDERNPVYSGAEHGGACKLPNITVVPNLRARDPRRPGLEISVLGCTMGHLHPAEPSDQRTQEVYEFQTHGMLVLDREDGRPVLFVAGPGDKVAVPSGCHMTLYNLGGKEDPLITLDFADPDHNPASKDLIQECGPILLATYDDFAVTLALSDRYINNQRHDAGVRLLAPPRSRSEREVRFELGARLDLGPELCARLTSPEIAGRLGQLGLEVARATPEAVLEPLPAGTGGRRLHLSLPLVDAFRRCLPDPRAATDQEDAYDVATPGYRYFFPDHCDDGHPPGVPGAMVREARESTRSKQELAQVKPSGDRLVVLVEGVGDWVEQAYVGMLRDRPEQVTAYFVDDSTWRRQPQGPAPTPPDFGSWAICYDKAKPEERVVYESHNPDVVFVVTPDFTHSAIARQWIGLTPLVMVEKPFDSDLAAVDELMRALAQRGVTAVLGLDHYQVYALGIHRLMPTIVEHLGGSLAAVEFRMTEGRPIESGRERSLQHGLTLDLLPHLPALLTFFGDVRTIDDIEILHAAQYRPLIAQARGSEERRDLAGKFRTETAAHLRFTFQDYSGNGFHVPCDALVGKGFENDVKYLEVRGVSGNAIRIDFNKGSEQSPLPGYPYNSLFFLQGDGPIGFASARTESVQDPYDATRTLRILRDASGEDRFSQPVERQRYERLIDALIGGIDAKASHDAFAGILHLHEAREIVRALDRIWRAVQAMRPWDEYELHGLDGARGTRRRDR